MSEVEPKIILLASPDTSESFEYLFPIPVLIVWNAPSLVNKINNRFASTKSKLERYFIICPESIGDDEDETYNKLEEIPEVIAVFQIWNDESIPEIKYTKVYYIQKELITTAVTINTIQFLKDEIKKQVKLDELVLAQLYIRKAEKMKEWLMSNTRAEPCHILLIPLNTNHSNVLDSIQRIKQQCAYLGYTSVIVRLLNDYIPPLGELYNQLPYGKILFEYEDPKTICGWLKELSPMRMYLYGNEQVISSEWSKQMISYETDHAGMQITNDDDWHTFIENESIQDDIKWNFNAKHGATWKISQFMPLKLTNLNENIRFKSALRRAHITYDVRKLAITTRIYSWYDKCSQFHYIPNEFQLQEQRQGSIKPLSLNENASITNIFPLGFYSKMELNTSSSISYNEESIDSSLHSFNQSYELVDSHSHPSDRIYIWLDTDLIYIEERFRHLIYPNNWNYFNTIDTCQNFIRNQQLKNSSKIFLIARNDIAEQLFRNDLTLNISNIYLYSDQHKLFINRHRIFPVRRRVYSNLDALYDKLSSDIACNVETNLYSRQKQKNETSLIPGYFESANESFQLYRILCDSLLKLPRTLDAKQALVDELRRTYTEIGVSPQQIDEFERDYHANAAIQWYTRDTFMYRLINDILRSNEISLIIKYRLLITDLCNALSELHNQIIHWNDYSIQKTMTCYRGQYLSSSEIDQFKQNIGSVLSINVFLSTSLSFDIASMFIKETKLESTPLSLEPVLFTIEVDPTIKNTRPYALIKSFSHFTDEDEVLFAVGSVFRIEKVEMLSVNDTILVIYLKMIDESELPEALVNISEFIPHQLLLNPTYTLIGLSSLLEKDEQSERIQSILEESDVKFFQNTDEFEQYQESIKTVQSFFTFISSEAHVPRKLHQTEIMSYSPNDTHFNDLIYHLVIEMKVHKKSQEFVKDLYMKLANIYCPSNDDTFYVYLLLSSTSKKDSENELKTKFSSSSIITFYQTEPCIDFLESLTLLSELDNAILLLQCDDKNLDNLVDQFENIDSIRHIYLCSKYAFDIKSRRIIHGRFLNEHDLHTQLYSNHILNSYMQTNQQLQINKNKQEAMRYLKQTEQLYELLKEHQNQRQSVNEE